MLNCQTELPEAAAVARSVGVVTRKSGDLAEGEGVRRRTLWLEVKVEVLAEGRGSDIVWTGSDDIEERISIAGEDPLPELPSACAI